MVYAKVMLSNSHLLNFRVKLESIRKLTRRANYTTIRAMQVRLFFLKILEISSLILVTYLLYGLVISSISLKECISDVERGKLGEIMYHDEKICIIRQNMPSKALLEFDQIKIHNGKKYLLSFPDACCFKTLYEYENRREQRYLSTQSIENILANFNNYYEDSSVIQLMKYYINY